MQWFSDIIIEFLIRTIYRWMKCVRSRNCTRVDATPSGASAEPYNLFGCCKVLISYTYAFRGQLYTGYFRKPFLSQESAEDYAKIFQGVTRLAVRVNPDNPADSFPRDTDQSFAASVASRIMS